MPASFARKLAHFIQLSELELAVLRSMPAQVHDVQARTDIVADGHWPEQLSLITEGFACRYKLLSEGRRQIMAFLIPGDICDLRALLTGKMDHAVAALNDCRVGRGLRRTRHRAPLGLLGFSCTFLSVMVHRLGCCQCIRSCSGFCRHSIQSIFSRVRMEERKFGGLLLHPD